MSLSMLNRSIASMAGRAPGGSYDVQEYFWGAELSKDKPSFKWNPEVRLWLLARTSFGRGCWCWLSSFVRPSAPPSARSSVRLPKVWNLSLICFRYVRSSGGENQRRTHLPFHPLSPPFPPYRRLRRNFKTKCKIFFF